MTITQSYMPLDDIVDLVHDVDLDDEIDHETITRLLLGWVAGECADLTDSDDGIHHIATLIALAMIKQRERERTNTRLQNVRRLVDECDPDDLLRLLSQIMYCMAVKLSGGDYDRECKANHDLNASEEWSAYAKKLLALIELARAERTAA